MNYYDGYNIPGYILKKFLQHLKDLKNPSYIVMTGYFVNVIFQL